MAVTSVKTGSSFTSLIKYDSLLAGNQEYSPGAFFSIATATPTSGTTASFTSIPTTYKSLQVRVNGFVSSSASFTFTVNSDTGTNYSWHGISADVNNSTQSSGVSAASIRLVGTAAVVQAANPLVSIIDIHDYASTSKYKTTRSVSGFMPNTNTNGFEMYSGLWRSLSAITSLTITTSTGFASGTSVALYGVR